MQVTKAIYGPGTYRRSRELLAAPGIDYPDDYVLAVTGGDRSLIVTDSAVDPLAGRILDAIVETPADTDDEEVAAGVSIDGGETLDELSKAELLSIAAERGIKVPAKATKVQLIGAISAALEGASAEDAAAEASPAEEE